MHACMQSCVFPSDVFCFSFLFLRVTLTLFSFSSTRRAPREEKNSVPGCGLQKNKTDEVESRSLVYEAVGSNVVKCMYRISTLLALLPNMDWIGLDWLGSARCRASRRLSFECSVSCTLAEMITTVSHNTDKEKKRKRKETQLWLRLVPATFTQGPRPTLFPSPNLKMTTRHSPRA